MLKLPRDTVLSFYDPDPHVNVVDLLPNLRVKTLVVHGTVEKLALDAPRYLAKKIAGAKLYCFKGAGHLPAWTATEEFVCDCGNLSTRAPLMQQVPISPSGRLTGVRSIADRYFATGCILLCCGVCVNWRT